MADDQTDPTASADANPPDPAGPVAPLEGEVVAHDAAGTVVRRACFRAGALHGPFRLYGPSGGLVREAFYEDGLAHGPATDYDAQGRLLAETTWRAGRRDGPARVYRNGRLSIEMVWKGDLLEGPLVARHEGGAVAAVIPHRAGLPDGVTETFGPDGALMTSVAMVGGVRHGPSVVYDADGREVERVEWIDGAPAATVAAAGADDPARAFYAALADEGARRSG